jgi:serine/threonine protein phosphatase PrpC
MEQEREQPRRQQQQQQRQQQQSEDRFRQVDPPEAAAIQSIQPPPANLQGRIRGSPPFTFTQEEIDFRGLSHTFVEMYDGEKATIFKKSFSKNALPLTCQSLEMAVNIGFDPIGGGTYKSEGQDDCEIAVLPSDRSGPGDIIFGLFDGHGAKGATVSHFCTARYGTLLLENERFMSNLQRALEETTLNLHSELSAYGVDVEMSGTTAVIGVVRDGVLYVANVGDSRCIIGSRRKNLRNGVLEVTFDHKPSNPSEKRRIEKCGGRCEPMKDGQGNFLGESRVYLKNEEVPGLGMSRSIGDKLAHTVGVSAAAEVTVTELRNEDEFFVAGSDGLWDVIPNEEVVKIVSEKLAWNRRHPKQAVLIAEELALEAQHRWRQLVLKEDNVVDDVSVVLCVFDQVAGTGRSERSNGTFGGGGMTQYVNDPRGATPSYREGGGGGGRGRGGGGANANPYMDQLRSSIGRPNTPMMNNNARPPPSMRLPPSNGGPPKSALNRQNNNNKPPTLRRRKDQHKKVNIKRRTYAPEERANGYNTRASYASGTHGQRQLVTRLPQNSRPPSGPKRQLY